MGNDYKKKNIPPQAETPDNLPSVEIGDPDGETEVIGVKFRNSGKVYFFHPAGIAFQNKDAVIVRTSRGLEFGTVTKKNQMVPNRSIVPPLRPVVRKATEEDVKKNAENLEKEKSAFDICLEKIAARKLEMKLVDAEYTFDNTKLVFYFSADGRVDFRELVKDLASAFRTRIELRQIGIRDEAKMVGGLGICGLPFCCTTFLSDFTQVSIKIAKEQNLSLNSSKISGTCGRLMCCLRFEAETYQEGLKLCPPAGSKVQTPDGIGNVTEVNPLSGMCKVSFRDATNAETVKYYFRDQLVRIPKEKPFRKGSPAPETAPVPEEENPDDRPVEDESEDFSKNSFN
ncbi:MAG: stage 0 sporulation family protein [Clostridia bacterium]|nr:stage 0 sporulation family protein [Clostridia bacterium]